MFPSEAESIVMAKAATVIDAKPNQAAEPLIPDSLRYFDSLPEAANVRLPVVMALFGCSAPTIWRMVKRGHLDRPIKLSPRISAWNVGALRRTLAAIHAKPAPQQASHFLGT